MKIKLYVSVFFFGMAVLISSCGILGDNDWKAPTGEDNVYGGIYAQGFEDSTFRPCLDENEVWKLVDIQDTSFSFKLSKVKENPVYMELQGVPSEKGEYRGFFITYDREFTVREVVHVTSTGKKDCS